MAVVTWITQNWQAVLAGVAAFCAGLIPIFMLIPGEQPEKFLQGAVDFITKFSVKKD